ncbi:hypothetical protein CEXT_322151 [Caerostris extrusa]|uniref:G-protein coupled receptors family 1 profile domain-containing protein n=1 Tax=Caerostris extrusa TaxID=172846 RepID=A0AAV4THD6_CAEEX|nr:hypothetical protein CEXT_322151 [Caerostris extrusa]
MSVSSANETLLETCNANPENDTFKSYTVLETTLIASITTLLSLVTIIGNVLVMVSFNMDKRLQTVNNYFLLSLAVADFMIEKIPLGAPIEEEEERTCKHQIKQFVIAFCNIDCDEGAEEENLSPGGNTPSSVDTPVQSSRATSVSLRPDQITYIESLINQEKEEKNQADSIYTVLIRLPEQTSSEPELQPSVTMIPGEIPKLPAPMRSS